MSFSKGCFEVLQILWMIAEDYNRAVSVSLKLLQAPRVGLQGRIRLGGDTQRTRDTPIKIKTANIRGESDNGVGFVLFGCGRS